MGKKQRSESKVDTKKKDKKEKKRMKEQKRTAAQKVAARPMAPQDAPCPSSARTVVGAWDLHSHSTFSDGSASVDELIAEARAFGLAALAVTDHDSLRQLSPVRALARREGFPVLAGTEVSARDYTTGRNVHILAFGLEATPDGSGPLERIVDDTLRQRTANTLWQAWLLRRRGAEFSGRYISLDEVVATAGASLGVYKQHVMEALTHRHHEDPDYQFFYQCQFKGESPANHDIVYPAAADAVRAWIRRSPLRRLAVTGCLSRAEAITMASTARRHRSARPLSCPTRRARALRSCSHARRASRKVGSAAWGPSRLRDTRTLWSGWAIGWVPRGSCAC